EPRSEDGFCCRSSRLSCRAEPYRSIMEHCAAAGQTGIVNHRDMVGKSRQLRTLNRECRPIGTKVEFSVGMGKAVKKMAGLERRTAIEPAAVRKALDLGQSADPQSPVDQLKRAHRQTRVVRAEPPGKAANDIMVRPAFGVGWQDRGAEPQRSVGADVITLEG